MKQLSLSNRHTSYILKFYDIPQRNHHRKKHILWAAKTMHLTSWKNWTQQLFYTKWWLNFQVPRLNSTTAVKKRSFWNYHYQECPRSKLKNKTGKKIYHFKRIKKNTTVGRNGLLAFIWMISSHAVIFLATHSNFNTNSVYSTINSSTGTYSSLTLTGVLTLRFIYELKI